jgi:hypothetical protein
MITKSYLKWEDLLYNIRLAWSVRLDVQVGFLSLHIECQRFDSAPDFHDRQRGLLKGFFEHKK